MRSDVFECAAKRNGIGADHGHRADAEWPINDADTDLVPRRHVQHAKQVRGAIVGDRDVTGVAHL